MFCIIAAIAGINRSKIWTVTIHEKFGNRQNISELAKIILRADRTSIGTYNKYQQNENLKYFSPVEYLNLYIVYENQEPRKWSPFPSSFIGVLFSTTLKFVDVFSVKVFLSIWVLTTFYENNIIIKLKLDTAIVINVNLWNDTLIEELKEIWSL